MLSLCYIIHSRFEIMQNRLVKFSAAVALILFYTEFLKKTCNLKSIVTAPRYFSISISRLSFISTPPQTKTSKNECSRNSTAKEEEGRKFFKYMLVRYVKFNIKENQGHCS